MHVHLQVPPKKLGLIAAAAVAVAAGASPVRLAAWSVDIHQ